MERLLQSIKITINDKIYVKDPESSELGRRILENSIILIDEIGFEAFTFKKLGDRIGSNESSIYRYFENKHKLLVYLTSWYWGWLEYQLVFATNNLPSREDKLKKAIEVVTQPVQEDHSYLHINEVVLNRIVINESSKSFLTKEVDEENRNGYFVIYKRIVERLAEMIAQVDNNYKFPSSLASTILEGALHQYFLRDHFPALTDCDGSTSPKKYFIELVFKTLNKSNNV